MTLTETQTLKLITIYKVCKGIERMSELSDDELLYIATHTKRCANTSKGEKERWAPDWLSIGLPKLAAKDRDDLWKRIAELAEGHVVIKTQTARKTMAAEWDCFQDPKEVAEYIDKNATHKENIYNIYEATGKIVHIRQLEKLAKGNAESTDLVVINLLKKLNPTMPQITNIYKYLQLAVKNKTKTRLDMFLLPEHILELRNKFREKQFPAISLAAFKQDKEKCIANLTLCGYRLSIVEPVYKNSDVSYYKAVRILNAREVYTMQETPELLGLCSIYPHEGRPAQLFLGDVGDTVKTRVSCKEYIDLSVARCNANKEQLDKFLTKPKAFYISEYSDRPHEWNYEAIALDFYHETNIAINPDIIQLLKPFGNKEPIEWLDAI